MRSALDFERVLAGGGRVHEKWLTAAMRSNEAPAARLGLAISARAVPAATDRNRIKRQTRESFRHHRTHLPQLDIVILARPGAGGVARDELRATLERLWQRIAGAKPA